MKVINRVTITGADDSIKPEELLPLTEKYPHVEWGILLSQTSEGRHRFPTWAWMRQLLALTEHHPDLQLSGHLCGRWVREICKGNWSFLDERPDISVMFRRFQLNFHAQVHKLDKPAFIKGLQDPRLEGKQFIFQLDDVNNDILEVAADAGINAVPLFDTSGGAGRLPVAWPHVTKGRYTGYSGGLAPKNIATVMPEILKVCGEGPIWIDVETRVRSAGDAQFNMTQVQEFIENAQPWVMNSLEIQ
jgi:hypothetical protein